LSYKRWSADRIIGQPDDYISVLGDGAPRGCRGPRRSSRAG